MPWNSVHKSYEQSWWQRTALFESNTHQEPVWLIISSVNQSLGCTETEWPITNGPEPHTPEAHSSTLMRVKSWSSIPQPGSTSAFPESEVQIMNRPLLSSTLIQTFPGMLRSLFPLMLEHSDGRVLLQDSASSMEGMLDSGNPWSITSTAWLYTQLRSSTLHSHCKQYGEKHCFVLLSHLTVARIVSRPIIIMLHGLAEHRPL